MSGSQGAELAGQHVIAKTVRRADADRSGKFLGLGSEAGADPQEFTLGPLGGSYQCLTSRREYAA